MGRKRKIFSSTIEHLGQFDALKKAIEIAKESPCQKSKRGVVVWNGENTQPITTPRGLGQWDADHNGPPPGFACDGSPACRAHCSKLCLHAEERVILGMEDYTYSDMLHIKVVDGEAVPSGPPSCWQCSRKILEKDFERIWLMHDEDGSLVLKSYTATEFHEQTLINCGLPVIKK
jgi:hypothetical protein